MNKLLYKYIMDKKRLLSQFSCDEDYHITVCTGLKWRVSGEDGLFILSYWDEAGKQTDAVVSKKDGEPLIYKTNDLTMIIGIDCIKIAFIMKNKDNIDHES